MSQNNNFNFNTNPNIKLKDSNMMDIDCDIDENNNFNLNTDEIRINQEINFFNTNQKYEKSQNKNYINSNNPIITTNNEFKQNNNFNKIFPLNYHKNFIDTNVNNHKNITDCIPRNFNNLKNISKNKSSNEFSDSLIKEINKIKDDDFENLLSNSKNSKFQNKENNKLNPYCLNPNSKNFNFVGIKEKNIHECNENMDKFIKEYNSKDSFEIDEDLLKDIDNIIENNNFPDFINGYFYVNNVSINKEKKIKLLTCIDCLEKNFYHEKINSFNRKNNNETDEIIEKLKNSCIQYIIELSGSWNNFDIDPDDLVYLHSDMFDKNTNRYIISYNGENKKLANFIILEPEIMLSPTEVKNSLRCIRKEFFSQNMKILNLVQYSPALVTGKLIHKVTEDLFTIISKDREFEITHELIKELLKKEIENFSHDIYLLEKNIEVDYTKEILNNSYEYIDNIYLLLTKFVVRKANFQDIYIDEIIGVEKLFYSQKIGLKGTMDIVLKTKNNSDRNNLKSESFITPLEMKTGKNSLTTTINDKFQVLIYFLILMENFKQTEHKGILLYIKKLEMNVYHLQRIELVELLSTRNIVAKNKKRNLLKKKTTDNVFDIPEIIDQQNICNYCFGRSICYTYHLNYESPKIKEVVADILDKRNNLVNLYLEQINKKSYKAENLKTKERIIIAYETENREMNNVNRISPKNFNIENGKINYNFDQEILKYSDRILPYQIREGFLDEDFLADQETVEYFKKYMKIIADEEFFFNCEDLESRIEIKNKKLSHNFKLYQINHIIEDEIKYILVFKIDEEDENFFIVEKKALKENQQKEELEDVLHFQLEIRYYFFDSINNCYYTGVLENKIIKDPENKFIHISILKIYVKDKNFVKNVNHIYIRTKQFTGFISRISKGNVYSFSFYKEYENLRNLIIKNKIINNIIDDDYKKNVTREMKTKFKQEYKQLNNDQQNALTKILFSNQFSIVVGFPGTGKTTLIVLAAKILQHMKKKVLVCAYTNIALDNILIRMKKEGIKFKRLGNENKIKYEELKDSKIHSSLIKTTENWEEFYENNYIIGCSVLGIMNPMLIKEKFDYCFVDESSQIMEYYLLGPLLISKVFVLIGDPYQLPPVLKSIEEQPETLLNRLINLNPANCSKLGLQYRMNKDILFMINKVVYDDSLSCGNEKVENRKTNIDQDLLKNYITEDKKYLLYVLNNDNSVIFLNYDTEKLILEEKPENNKNPFEAKIIEEIIMTLKYLKYKLTEVAVITPYLSQEIFLKNKLEIIGFCDIMTIDKSQGIEKDIIIISFVKGGNYNKDFMEKIERLNVAFSRAKMKLICIGDISQLKKIEKLDAFWKIFEINNWILDYFEDSSLL